jgi:hypothetical protein
LSESIDWITIDDFSSDKRYALFFIKDDRLAIYEGSGHQCKEFIDKNPNIRFEKGWSL